MDTRRSAETSVRLKTARPTEREGDRWTAFLAGDCVVGDRVAERPFGESLTRRMRGSDLTVVNLEGAIRGSAAPLTKYGPLKETSERTPELLADVGVDAVTLANTHAMDYGRDGLFETMAACRDAGIGVCGAGSDITAALSPLRVDVADGAVSVALIGLCEREFGVATETDPGAAWIDHPEVRGRIETAATRADVVIVFAHGGIEYVPISPLARHQRLRSLVEAGADVVVGHHPHVPQGWERVDDGVIFYSLGNFLFSQPRRPKTQRGLALELTGSGRTPLALELVPTEIVDGTVREMRDGSDRREFLDHLRQLTEISEGGALEAHWQEVADRIFLQRYSSWLRKAAGGDPVSMIKQPDLHLRGDGLWDTDRRRSEMLLLLNLVRNESHRSVIETAIELRTGVGTDRRTPAVESTVRELISRTEDREVYDQPSTSGRQFRSLVEQLVPTSPSGDRSPE